MIKRCREPGAIDNLLLGAWMAWNHIPETENPLPDFLSALLTEENISFEHANFHCLDGLADVDSFRTLIKNNDRLNWIQINDHEKTSIVDPVFQTVV